MHRIRKILEQKEGLRLEFKLASTEFLPDNLFESICAMLNREGGDIFLGVKDDGTLSGIRPEYIDRITSDLVNLSNNPSKLDPPFILHPKVYEFEGKSILHIAVPQSSEVHKCGKNIYDRGHQGDYKVTQLSHIALLYNRKRNYYSEAIIYPALTLSDFKPELFTIARNLSGIIMPTIHGWVSVMNNY
ncbi:AlbA family DNA-binding domain-containing protein [Pedobacter caeni]|nr:ATP-binding protein [Pedobacter caeni]